MLLGHYALNPDVTNVWPGVAGLFQVLATFLSHVKVEECVSFVPFSSSIILVQLCRATRQCHRTTLAAIALKGYCVVMHLPFNGKQPTYAVFPVVGCLEVGVLKNPGLALCRWR